MFCGLSKEHWSFFMKFQFRLGGNQSLKLSSSLGSISCCIIHTKLVLFMKWKQNKLELLYGCITECRCWTSNKNFLAIIMKCMSLLNGLKLWQSYSLCVFPHAWNWVISNQSLIATFIWFRPYIWLFLTLFVSSSSESILRPMFLSFSTII